MEVELVRWPDDRERLSEVRDRDVPRLILVSGGVAPPLNAGILEDWVRLPADDEDIAVRTRVLLDRASGSGTRLLPELDEHGLLRLAGKWVALPPVEYRLTAALLERYRAVVSREALARAGWPSGMPGRNVLDVHIVRLRRRLAQVDLSIQTVRGRGYLLEHAAPGLPVAT